MTFRPATDSGPLPGTVPPGTRSRETEAEDRQQMQTRDAMLDAADLAILAAHFPKAKFAHTGRTWTADGPAGKRVALGPGSLAWLLIKDSHRTDTSGPAS